MRTIHFFACRNMEDTLRKANLPLETTWGGTMEAIAKADADEEKNSYIHANGDWVVRTTQMGLLNAGGVMLSEGWHIVIHDRTGVYAISIGDKNDRTLRYINEVTNLFRLWQNGEFDRKVRR